MSEPAQTLDVRPIPPRDKHPTIFRLLDALKAGEALRIVNDHDPLPLYYQIQAQYPGAYGWNKIEDGPETWRVDIVKA